MSHELENEYYDWICDIIDDHNASMYSKLLRYLFDREFEYIIPRDENRAVDGIDLRHRFAREKHIDNYIVDDALEDKPCSILEMMTALCIRIEESIMSNGDYGDRTQYWFWEMIFNLGLRNMTDSGYNDRVVEQIVTRFIERRYSPNGRGGLVTVYRPGTDLTKVELWYQVMWYLSEFEDE